VTTARREVEWEPGDTRPDLPRLRPGRRRGRRVAAGLAIGCGLVAAGMVATYAVTPSVSGARSQARAQDAAHHVRRLSGVVPGRFGGALVATEDQRFYSEPGIDPIALGRVVIGALTGRADQGGSTLSVQLAKMLYTPGNDGVTAKAEQAVLAVKLNLSYSKSDILRMYADVVYFGAGYYGLTAASCGYFGTEPGALTWGQAAVLAGLVQAPSAYDPRAHPDQARLREQHVLDRMVATHEISRRQADAALAAPLHLNPMASASRCP
jgi:membrane peptidoglycan carboxypeptidase